MEVPKQLINDSPQLLVSVARIQPAIDMWQPTRNPEDQCRVVFGFIDATITAIKIAKDASKVDGHTLDQRLDLVRPSEPVSTWLKQHYQRTLLAPGAGAPLLQGRFGHTSSVISAILSYGEKRTSVWLA
jgi:hypothetical protein